MSLKSSPNTTSSPTDITILAPFNAEIQAAIPSHLCSTTHKLTLLTFLLICRKSYSDVIHNLYRDVVLDSTNVERFLGPLLAGDDESGALELQASGSKLAKSITQYLERRHTKD
ncbi:hypothetical protein IAR50_001776 [Cryptococcus sp. DSM 104548]